MCEGKRIIEVTAAEKAKSLDVDDLSKALHSITAHTVVGSLTWDKKGDVIDSKYLFYAWKNGAFPDPEWQLQGHRRKLQHPFDHAAAPPRSGVNFPFSQLDAVQNQSRD
jgi:hypothetical protein